MHSPERVAAVLELAELGRNASEVSREFGVPRSTVREWMQGLSRASSRAGPGCMTCGGDLHDFENLPPEYVYLLGMYLGDGCIATHPRGVFRLRIVLDSAYPGVIQECADAVTLVRPRNRVSIQVRTGNFANSAPGAFVEIGSYSKSWPCLFPQHGPGKKHHRVIELAGWQVTLVDRWPERLLRGLIHSDGCRFINTGTNWRHPRYLFSNMSDDIRRIFCDACDRLGLHWTEAPNSVYVSKKKDVAILDTYIGAKR